MKVVMQKRHETRFQKTFLAKLGKNPPKQSLFKSKYCTIFYEPVLIVTCTIDCHMFRVQQHSIRIYVTLRCDDIREFLATRRRVVKLNIRDENDQPQHRVRARASLII